jgi:hypothetical protein
VLFALTWVPEAAAYTPKTGKRRKAFAMCQLLSGKTDSVLPDVEG